MIRKSNYVLKSRAIAAELVPDGLNYVRKLMQYDDRGEPTRFGRGSRPTRFSRWFTARARRSPTTRRSSRPPTPGGWMCIAKSVSAKPTRV